MRGYYYGESIATFLDSSSEAILGILTTSSQFALEMTQRDAWLSQIHLLQKSLPRNNGYIFFEYSIPRMGKRADAVIIAGDKILVLEFKVGATSYNNADVEQVWDYALDLKNFHETSHNLAIFPILIATDAPAATNKIIECSHNDNSYIPMRCNNTQFKEIVNSILSIADKYEINVDKWLLGGYRPTPTIIEAAIALYSNHSVAEISRNDAEATNISITSQAVTDIIKNAKENKKKCICFITGVPGAGKTLVGLDIATKHIDEKRENSSVFLSGNGPLVSVLRESLARDRVKVAKEQGKKIKKSEAEREVKMFIQNVHHFRDDCLKDEQRPPHEHVAIFDEAQRAWDLAQTASFMKRKKNKADFNISEPTFLISCLDRHKDWAVIVCLVGGGQEINVGEAGIQGWIDALTNDFPEWSIFLSDRLTDSEYGAGKALQLLRIRKDIFTIPELHLAVSIRSFRAEKLSAFIKSILDLNPEEARSHFSSFKSRYPIKLTRDIEAAKSWVRSQARGSERYGLIVSSQAQRLKPFGIDVRYKIDPVHWFLNGKEDTRSSFYLEDVATEFQVQGLELDWICVAWDADFRLQGKCWEKFSFRGDRWERINKLERKMYLKNAYRVLLTRGRQGLVIVVPHGNKFDPTRSPSFYDETFAYLESLGLDVLERENKNELYYSNSEKEG